MAAAPPHAGGAAAGFSTPPVPHNPWNSGSLAVAVWEWQDEHKKWRPYSSVVSSYIEQCMQLSQQQKGPRGPGNSSSISLGQADPQLSPYIIDIVTLTQFRQDTGTMRFVRKFLYPSDSAPGKGICWEWMNDDGNWAPYEMQVTIFLEEAFCNRHQSADLTILGLHYHVDFVSCVQTNKMTGFRRQVQRRLDTPYTLCPKTGPVHRSAACACHQCLASSGAGPISTRNRHSMVNLPTSSNYQNSSRTSLISTNNVGYLPYPKPSMTSAKSTPKLNSTYQPPSTSMSFPGPSSTNGIRIPSIPVQTQRQSIIQPALAGGPVEPEQVVKKYLENVEKPSNEDCIICMEALNSASGYTDASESKNIKPAAVGKLKNCGHIFHQLCMLAMYNNGNKDGSLQCPSCKTIYGEKTGTQPKGEMQIFLIPQSLPGHEDCKTIHIVYTINPGTQGPGHPNPGKPYTARGFPRHCYLPDNNKGRLVLELLKLAWARRLIFTIGVSSTTGESDTVVWNEIHHKTEMNSNITGHGYPDPNYLDNVIAELAAQGVSEDCLKM
ncbi:probable E3 ubiquitin-protein ligase DTX2 isoform X2 [Spea bombifrons]|uniref:probable E3 ubiquitin-protein ligase DTX2 isoform X2 n=1 Tax=Spea bombifrons TaxID=233779 RepID=UPI00234B60AB|nr:probable E3 ubiquitin-protein ligase DTX2 isoform X2 [Spea bombifrons]